MSDYDSHVVDDLHSAATLLSNEYYHDHAATVLQAIDTIKSQAQTIAQQKAVLDKDYEDKDYEIDQLRAALTEIHMAVTDRVREALR